MRLFPLALPGLKRAPFLDSAMRTSSVRIDVENPEIKLQPDMRHDQRGGQAAKDGLKNIKIEIPNHEISVPRSQTPGQKPISYQYQW